MNKVYYPRLDQANTRDFGFIVTDPQRDALLQRVTFKPLKLALANYHLYALLAPHIGNCGYGNDGWIGD